jgi:hypothetical protein
MEYIDGPTLKDFLEKKPAITFVNAQKIISDLYEGLFSYDLWKFRPEKVLLRKEADATYTIRFIDLTTWAEGNTFRTDTGAAACYQQVVKTVADMINDVPAQTKEEFVQKYENKAHESLSLNVAS